MPKTLHPQSARLAGGTALPMLLATGVFALASCASVSFARDTQTSGTFRSSGIALTLVSIDMPKGALQIARENAADSGLPNLIVKESHVYPYLGPIDWLLDILSIRYAYVSGTFGYPPEQVADPAQAVAAGAVPQN